MEELNNVVKTEIQNGVMIITLNREANGNAVNPDLTAGLEAALNEAETNSDVGAVVLTGAGNKFFSAGMDLKHMAQYGSAGVFVDGHGFAGICERSFAKPLISAVNGYALGGGLEIAMSADIIIAADHAKFGLPETSRGVIAAAAGPIRLMRSIPKGIAIEMLLTGNHITAQRAYEIGLISRVVPAERLLDEAMEIAEKIAANSPTAVMATKELAYRSYGLSLEDAMKISAEMAERVKASGDVAEGAKAFAEKRTPKWKKI